MGTLLTVLDLLTVLAAFASSALWFISSQSRARRISRHETLDAADMNRLVVAMNRAQILSSRAAAMTGVAALLAAVRLSLDLLGAA
jgi:hypothetical protein